MAAANVQPAGSSVNPVTCVKNVLTAGKIDQNRETQNKRILNEFLDKLLPAMKRNDRDFARIFQKLYFTGSYYENLRISDPNEFDINVILKLPFRPQERDLEYVRDVKSFMKYKLKMTQENIGVLRENEALLRTLFEGEYLCPGSVRYWIQGVVDRALPSVIPLPSGVKKIIPSASGPAKTMVLETVYGYDIDIDLVPVIQFTFPEWPKGARKDMLNTFQVKNEDRFWFLVPKEFPANDNVNPIDAKRLWRIHFPEIEKKIIHNRGHVKPLIKLLKALRSNEGWHILASYYLKTVVLWLVERNPSVDYWKENYIFLRLIEALESLRESVSKKFIRYYFYPEFNLIQKIGQSQADIICNRLDKILRDIKANPEKLESYFRI